MTGFNSYLDARGHALQLRWQRMELLASNIANAATPGYKARDIDFAAALKQRSSTDGGGRATPPLLYRQPLMASLDGNTVELAVEQAAFADNAVRYRASLSFLESRAQTLVRALKGE